jgi:hypothetical protein
VHTPRARADCQLLRRLGRHRLVIPDSSRGVEVRFSAAELAGATPALGPMRKFNPSNGKSKSGHSDARGAPHSGSERGQACSCMAAPDRNLRGTDRDASSAPPWRQSSGPKGRARAIFGRLDQRQPAHCLVV